MPNPYTKNEGCVPLTTRSALRKTANFETEKETKCHYTEFVCSSGPPGPCDYENKRDERKMFSVFHHLSDLLANDSVEIAKRPATKPIAEAMAGQKDSGDEFILIASLMSDDHYSTSVTTVVRNLVIG
jgi:hypothetical protein